MGKVLSFVNLKGGVGKTSSVVNIATIFAQMGYSTLIIDLDKQSNATQYLNRYDEALPSTYNVLLEQKTLQNIIRDTEITNLSIAPASIEMVNLRSVNSIYLLSSEIKKINFDYIFIDCPPDLNHIVDSALAASTDVFIPIKIDNWALLGFGYLLGRIHEITNQVNPRLKFTGAFITMDKARTNVSKEAKAKLREHLGDTLLNTTIRENATLVTSTFYEKPVVLFNKNCNSAIDYNNLAIDIIEKLK